MKLLEELEKKPEIVLMILGFGAALLLGGVVQAIANWVMGVPL